MVPSFLRGVLFAGLIGTAPLLVASTLFATPRESLIGLAFIALGIPLYLFQRRNEKEAAA